jgi:hypothetical protein
MCVCRLGLDRLNCLFSFECFMFGFFEFFFCEWVGTISTTEREEVHERTFLRREQVVRAQMARTTCEEYLDDGVPIDACVMIVV